ncbi:MAG: hypothetical protein IKE35_06015, partial [Lachnospiraceae bacterium]|nr:hypothetical protein [Lachnospiraceae bacterium]
MKKSVLSKLAVMLLAAMMTVLAGCNSGSDLQSTSDVTEDTTLENAEDESSDNAKDEATLSKEKK